MPEVSKQLLLENILRQNLFSPETCFMMFLREEENSDLALENGWIITKTRLSGEECCKNSFMSMRSNFHLYDPNVTAVKWYCKNNDNYIDRNSKSCNGKNLSWILVGACTHCFVWVCLPNVIDSENALLS